MNIRNNPSDPVQAPDAVTSKRKPVPTVKETFRSRLRRYGDQILQSVQHFNHVLREMVANMATALAGSFIMLPVVIVVRFAEVMLDNIFTLIRPLILSLLRAFVDGLRVLISPIRQVFVWYNQNILKPMLKEIREDDIIALLAFGALVLIIIMAVSTVIGFWPF